MDENVLMLAIFGGIGGLLMLVGLLLIVKMVAFGASAIVVTGVVTSVQQYRGPETGSTTKYYPAIRFQTPQGQELHFQSRGGHMTPLEIGAPIEVSYAPGRPDQAEIHAGSMWIGGLFVFLMGALFAGIGVAIHFAA